MDDTKHFFISSGIGFALGMYLIFSFDLLCLLCT